MFVCDVCETSSERNEMPIPVVFVLRGKAPKGHGHEIVVEGRAARSHGHGLVPSEKVHGYFESMDVGCVVTSPK
jgi:hypothetical protein